MSFSLPALTFVLALQSLEVAANTVDLPVPASMLERGNSVDGKVASSATTSTSSTSSKHQSSTTYSSNTHISSSSSSTSTRSSSTSAQSSSTITQPSSTFTTQSSSTSTFTLTGTVTSYAITTSSSSSSASNNVYGSTSAASQGLSTAARTGLAFGIMFFLILSAMLVCYLRRRSRIAREKAFNRPAVLSSEVSHPPAPGASPEGGLPALPPTRLNPAYPKTSNISRSRHSANSSIAPLLSDSSRTSHPASVWNRYGTLSQEINTRLIFTEDIPPLPNPYDQPSASARTVSHTSFTPANPYDASVLTSAATTSMLSAPVGSSSNSRGAHRSTQI